MFISSRSDVTRLELCFLNAVVVQPSPLLPFNRIQGFVILIAMHEVSNERETTNNSLLCSGRQTYENVRQSLPTRNMIEFSPTLRS